MAEPGERGRGRGGRGRRRRSHDFLFGGPQGPDWYAHPLEEFPLEGINTFVEGRKLRPYDDRTEPWPKCKCGEYCVVQVFDEFVHGGRRFYRCPFGYVSANVPRSSFCYNKMSDFV